MTAVLPTQRISSSNLLTTPLWWDLLQGDESAYRDEVLKLTAWCSMNNFALNTIKTKELISDFRKNSADTIYINGEGVRRVNTFKDTWYPHLLTSLGL